MAENLVSPKLQVKLASTLQNTLFDGSVATVTHLNLLYSPSLTPGINDNQVSRAFQAGGTLLSGASVTIELNQMAGLNIGAGNGHDALGQEVFFKNIATIAVLNNNDIGEVGELEVFPAAANGWLGLGTHLYDADAVDDQALKSQGLLMRTQLSMGGIPITYPSQYRLTLRAAGGDVDWALFIYARERDFESTSSSSSMSFSSRSSSSSKSSISTSSSKSVSSKSSKSSISTSSSSKSSISTSSSSKSSISTSSSSKSSISTSSSSSSKSVSSKSSISTSSKSSKSGSSQSSQSSSSSSSSAHNYLYTSAGGLDETINGTWVYAGHWNGLPMYYTPASGLYLYNQDRYSCVACAQLVANGVTDALAFDGGHYDYGGSYGDVGTASTIHVYGWRSGGQQTTFTRGSA